MGAIPLKQAVYVLPDSPAAREDFEWLKAEIDAAGGDASLLSASHLDAGGDTALVDEFKRVREQDYLGLSSDLEAAIKRAGRSRQPQGKRAPAVRRLTDQFAQRLAAIEAVDFFGSAGRDRALLRLNEFRQTRSQPAQATASLTSDGTLSGRLWVTRPRPGVDRMASAWLIRRFIDPAARFGFAVDRDAVAKDALPFDMFGVEFSHRGDACTYETLRTMFAIRNATVDRIGEIVHDLDLKDAQYGAAEAPTVAALIDGLQLAIAADDELLAQGMTLFESLYQVFSRDSKPSRPRGVSRKRSSKR